MTAARILLIVGGGIAAYKACELIRLLRRDGMTVRCVLTEGGAHFVTPMTLAALSEQPVHTSLWDLKDEAEMGHIRLSREADLVVLCPATADLLAKMAAGLSDSLATTLLLATDKPVLAVPAMNVRMWLHPATVRNVATLRADGVTVMVPDEGPMACGEHGPGRLPEPPAILAAIRRVLGERTQATAPSSLPPPVPTAPPRVGHDERLRGRHILVTAGPTHEPIDPVRYIANRSSGKQGFAVAAALARRGARVTLVAGPVALATPDGVDRIDVETAAQMAAAVDDTLPVDAAVLVAAVADWRVEPAAQKIKKSGEPAPALALTANPDILATLARSPRRPPLLVGFAAETQRLVEHARAKLRAKGVDWIVANDVSDGVFGTDRNRVHLVTRNGAEAWTQGDKNAIAEALAERIVSRFEDESQADRTGLPPRSNMTGSTI